MPGRRSAPLFLLLAVALPLLCFAADPPSAAPPGAHTVRMKFQDAPLDKILAEFARQTGITVEDRRGETATPVSVDLDGRPFWPALDAIAAAAGSRVDLTARDGRLAL